MMMALVSLMALTAQAQANFNVAVTNPSKMVKTDEPVVIDLSKLGSIGEIQRAVVTVDGKEIPSQLDDTNRDCTNDELCFLLDLGKKETKNCRCSSLLRANRRSILPVPSPNSVCLARTRSLPRTSRTSICEASPSTRRPRMSITMFIPTVSASRANWLPCASISTRDRPSTSTARSTRDW